MTNLAQANSKTNTTMTKIPNAVAPKSTQDFVSFQPFPESGPYVLTVCAIDFMPNFESLNRETGEKQVYDALQITYGSLTDSGARFVRPWPIKYSIHEKASYSKLYKAVKGSLPLAGSNAEELLGGGVQADLVNEDKTSKKGKAYTRTSIKSIAAVHPKLKGDITPLKTLLPKLADALKPATDTSGGQVKDTDEGPF